MLLLSFLILVAEPAPPPPLSLSTSPRHVFKENDGRDGHGKTESFVFRVVVRAAPEAAAEAQVATLELRSAQRVMKSLRLSGEALAAIREKPGKLSADADAAYLLRLGFDEPVAESIDNVLVRLETKNGTASLEVPVA